MYLTDTCIVEKITGGITITDIELSEIKHRITETIKEGLNDECRDLVEELMRSFYAEDIAAAAIMLYAGQGDRQEVRRRTLNKAPFVPLRTKESLTRGAKKLPAIQSRPRPASHGTPARSQPARSPPGAGTPGHFGKVQKGYKGQKGPGGHSTPQGKRR